MMALLKCCEEKHWFAMPLIHCWCERNLHSRQTRGRSRLSLAAWLDTSSLSSGWCYGSSHSALAHNLQAGSRGWRKNTQPKVLSKLGSFASWLRSMSAESLRVFMFDEQSLAYSWSPLSAMSKQVQHTFPLPLSLFTPFTVSLSAWQACCSPFGDSACYRGHADACRSIPTPKPTHLSESRVYVLGNLRMHIC